MPGVQSFFVKESSLLDIDLSFYSICIVFFSMLYNAVIKVYARGAKLFC
mgnify:CR=1 FL=1